MPDTTLKERRGPTAEEKARGAKVVFVREDKAGRLSTILAAECYESWEQWGAITDVLWGNVPDVEAWRATL